MRLLLENGARHDLADLAPDEFTAAMVLLQEEPLYFDGVLLHTGPESPGNS